MGIRVKRAGQIGLKLEKSADRSTRQLRRLHRQASLEVAETAQLMAPRKTGRLESGIFIEESYEGRRKVFRIKVDPSIPYAVKMHESTYNLGPGSLAKQEGGIFRVGRKYIERAAQHVLKTGRYVERAREIVRNSFR